MSAIDGSKILLGVTGGVSAYKSCYLVSHLIRENCQVEVIMTDSAQKFVGESSFSALTGKKVHTDIFNAPEGVHALHIYLSDWADVIVVAPATANTLAKLSFGLADNLLTATVLASRCPVLLAPAMNANMWNNTIVQENIAKLKGAGFSFVGPGAGRLACGTEGSGRMAEPEEIFNAIEQLLQNR